jgi:protocatechuate 3,4-dioxygenase beta subunit
MRLMIVALAIGLVAHPGVLADEMKPGVGAPVAAAAAVPTGAVTKPPPAKTITGKVTGPDGKPVAAATVRAIPMPKKTESPRRVRRAPDAPKAVVAKTDATGAFRLDGLATGPFALRIEAPGFAPTGANNIPAGAAVTLRLKPGTTVVGRVLDLTTQKPIANATVTGLEKDAARFGTDAAHTVKTAEDGTFILADCAPGIIIVEAIAKAKAKARLDQVVAKPVAPGEERNPDANTLYLQPGGRIAGRVLGPDGKPLADAIVTASPSDGSLFAMLREGNGAQRTDVDGKFAFDGIAAGNKYTVRATKEGLATKDDGPIPVEAGTDRADLELKLESGALLAFRLATDEDVPVKSVEVQLQPQGGGRRRGMGLGRGDVDQDKIEPQGDGKFLIKALDPGTFDLTLQPPDFADITKTGLKLKNGETTDLGTLRVKESKSISGRITDTSGRPIAGATISGLWLDAQMRLSREARSGEDGRFRLSGLGDQPLRNMSVRAEGYANSTREGATPGDTAVDFTLEKTGSVVGRVLSVGGAVPPAFRVQAFPEAKENQERQGFRVMIADRPEEDKIFTDPSGNFRLDGVDPGIVTITANADGKAPARKSGLTVVSDQVVDVGTITLEDGRALRGRVVAAKDDAPVPGATVSVAPPQSFRMSIGGDTTAGLAISGLDGRFEIAGLEPRTYAIDASQPDFSPNTGRVEIAADADTDDFVIKLSRGGTITGLVRDAQKVPQVGAQVLLTKVPMSGGPQTVSTGADGRYTFEKIAPGEYMVIRAPTGGGPLMLVGGMRQVVVKEGETTVHDLDDAAKINLTGHVLKGGQPVGNAMLFFNTSNGSGTPADLRQSRTDAEGRYQVGLDTAGSYQVVVASGGAIFGGAQSAISIQVPDQENPVVDITMKAAGISGRVTNAEGRPVSGAVVTVTATGAASEPSGHGRGGMQDRTEPDGSFLVEGLEPGVYGLTVAASGYRNAEMPPVTIANEDDVPSVDVRLEPGRTVRGRVLDAGGNGIAGAMVMAGPSGTLSSGRDSMQAVSDVNGAFFVTAPVDGPIDLTAVASGFPPARAVSIQPQDGVDVVLRAPRPAHVRVIVVNPDGNPVVGARVSCRAVPDYLGAGYASFLDRTPPTGADGATTVSSLAPGAYELTVDSESRRATAAATLAEGAEVVLTINLP